MASDGSHSALRHRARQAVSGLYPSTAYPTVPWRADRAADDYGVPATPGWREVDWPAHTHRADVHGSEVVYVDIGQGAAPPVVFVHGLAGKWQNWLENLPRVAEERRAIALDLPGFGESPMPSGEITVSGYAKLVAGLLEQLEIESAVVVGSSMGGFIAAELALEFAPRVERLVLAAAAGISITNLRRRPTMTGARVAGAISAVTLAQREAVVARPRLRHLAMSFVIRHPSRIRPDLLLEIAPGSNAPGFMDALEALLDYDFRDRLSDVSCPTLLVWGREDMLVPVGDADEFERLIAGSRKVIFDETGHVPMLERPESFNERLMAFLAEDAGSASGPQPVNAPSAAEPTWRAYLASTPVR
jgi:pimeloyl-ACP methyl ester carboxylesterase